MTWIAIWPPRQYRNGLYRMHDTTYFWKPQAKSLGSFHTVSLLNSLPQYSSYIFLQPSFLSFLYLYIWANDLLKTHCPHCPETSNCKQVFTCPYKYRQSIHSQTKQLWVIVPLLSSEIQTGLDDFSIPSVSATALLWKSSRLSPPLLFGRPLTSE